MYGLINDFKKFIDIYYKFNNSFHVYKCISILINILLLSIITQSWVPPTNNSQTRYLEGRSSDNFSI